VPEVLPALDLLDLPLHFALHAVDVLEVVLQQFKRLYHLLSISLLGNDGLVPLVVGLGHINLALQLHEVGP
jgi:hypothetical protein